MSEFDAWNELKKKLDCEGEGPNRFPQESEVWMAAVGRNIGFEQNGSGNHFSRPVLVIKKFNNQMFWVVPLSTKQKDIDFYFNYTDPHKQNVSAILAQMRLVSVRRLQRKIYEILPQLFCQLKERLKSFF